ncbi:benzoate 4-monooxygenase cytochrome P450 [Mytilinidion resinicola]|uniref:Benzoate 4-monooxygenase cytochrome P450 n=1 Tax=Mytilinidion resinicola TaxID=574789 RepID=A0A6A6Y8W8_9PEZI|nr:benzoate 4-monooxygenase cytochrome P450 [Mytilinidion resinicola]KAF2804404.1 benzoate 4-monooxygenase cytochrome P450 [Mytilinidion resinicola]
MILPLVLAIVASYVIATVIYNLFFHPLASTPGPLLARISCLPSFYHACKGDRHLWIWKQFQIHGDKIRAAPDLILFNTTRAYADIYGPRANTTRSAFYKMWQRSEHDVNTITATDPVLHAKKRRLLNLAFTEQSLKAASPFLVRHIDRWAELLVGEVDAGTEQDEVKNAALGGKRLWSSPRNMATWIDYLVFDLLGDLCFGQDFKTKEPGENKLKSLPHLIMKHVAVGYKLSKFPLLRLILWLKPRSLNAVMDRVRHKDIKDYSAFIENSVDQRIESYKSSSSSPSSSSVREDMFHFLITAKDPETNLPAFSRDHLLSEARLLVLAGTDTSATTICALFFYLVHNPAKLAKLVSEIRSEFSSLDDITLGPRLSQAKYLRACIDETLRLSHPAPSELPREVLSGGATIDGMFYPAGIVVGCANWSLGHNESVYGDANTFRPERWIPDEINTETDILNLRKGFHPFSIGPGNCAGQKVAMLELLLTFARTLWRLDVRIADGEKVKVGEGSKECGQDQKEPKQMVVKDAFLCLKDGPIVQFRRREM